jgi:homocysteine S-methyltransferase
MSAHGRPRWLFPKDGHVLKLDGAMGTELLRRGVPTPLPLWSAGALVKHPAVVEQIHRDYVQAGCQLITTNTFRTSRYTLEKAGLAEHWRIWNREAVRIARRAAGDRARILGSVATLEDCYRPDRVPDDFTLRRNHRAQIDLLVELGVDGLLLETFNTLRELEVAYREARRHSLPVITSVLLQDESHLYDGTELSHLVAWARRSQPDVMCLNCAPPAVIHGALLRLRRQLDLPLGAYANVGRPGGEMGFEFTHACTAVEYAAWLQRWTRLGLHVVGGCCGTSPEYLRTEAGGSRVGIIPTYALDPCLIPSARK